MTDRKEIIALAVRDAIALKTAFIRHREEWLLAASDRIANAFRNGNKLLIAGNGGSAADSQHFAAELVVRLTAQRNRVAFPAIALTVDSSIITAAANDFGFEHIFSRQVEALGNSGDVFIGISTSGNSENILNAFRVAKRRSLTTFALCGEAGIKEPELCDLVLAVPSPLTARVQEEHIFALHLLSELIEIMLLEK
jgi:D-sedoheptulose 7-phosphate isomerase